jgi:hypothetical protein
VQQEAELDLRQAVGVEPCGAGERDPVRGDALGVLARVGVARFDALDNACTVAFVDSRSSCARERLLGQLAQVGGVALELVLARGCLCPCAASAHGASRRCSVLEGVTSDGRPAGSPTGSRNACKSVCLRELLQAFARPFEHDLGHEAVWRRSQEEPDGLGDVGGLIIFSATDP